jgi:hypothetical protein
MTVLLVLWLATFFLPDAQVAQSNLTHPESYLVSPNDTIVKQADTWSPYTTSQFGFSVLLSLAMGHHDNLTDTKPVVPPELKTSNVYWNLQLGAGVLYRSATARYFLSLVVPIPRTKVIDDYRHEGELIEFGAMIQVRLFSWWSRANLAPVLGYKWVNERAKITDENTGSSDELNVKYNANALMAGGEASVLILKRERRDQRIALTYIYESFRSKVDRLKIEWRNEYPEPRGERNLVNGEPLESAGYWSFGVELVRRQDGRKDWFIVLAIGGEAKFHKFFK